MRRRVLALFDGLGILAFVALLRYWRWRTARAPFLVRDKGATPIC
jgi:hypothetical protein